ncbi:IQ motif and SEC7 domain-containing protein 3 [Camelus dromedarius]|uniref:IQ motif and SEC7 domain-containing protein 3 n=1 Tax=Camelus dromedarius TaxID=9838 RepID=A0A5N4C6J1_CAMDR|nr:IQ motif and SEC7 domain-containing protein 3 [Camelus dromedarius]
MLEHKYGGHLVSRRAACTIQTAFRQYQLSKNFEKIRNSLLESRLPRRISLRKVRAPTAESLAAERALLEGCGLAGLPLVRSPSLPPTFAGTLTELEDSFTEQVQSLAKSIDDALSTWSLKTMCSLQESGAYQLHQALRAGAGTPGLEAEAREPRAAHPGAGAEPAEPAGPPQGHGSTLMMAFRDVTVQMPARTSPSPPTASAEEDEEEAEEVGKGAEAEAADNSEQLSSSSTSTKSTKSGSEASASASKEALQAMVLSLPRYHCENPASCRSPTLSTDTLRKRRYRIGLNLFNINPDKGIQFLISRGFIPDTPIGVAHFLLQRKGLSRQMIGEFLGNSKKQFNRDVLE